MPQEETRLRVVGPGDAVRRRRPGAAFLFVCLYSALFGGALWYLGARTGIWKKTARKVGATSAAPVVPASERNGRGDGATRTSQRASSAEAAASAAKAGSAASQSSTGGRGEVASHDALLAGKGISEPARSRYFSRLATERCDCGCGRTLSDCLVNEKTCSRSPDLADQIRKSEIGNR